MPRFSYILLWMAAILPLAARAQTDPSAMPGSTPGPQSMPGSSSNQSTPGVTKSTTPYDSSTSGGAGDDLKIMRDKMFLRKAAAGGLAEVQLGQLAEQKAHDENVKKFGQRMADDHTRMNNAIQSIADAMGVVVPTRMNKPEQAEYDKLNGLAGPDFDKEYLAYTTAGHRRDLKDFHDEATSGGDQNLKDAAAIGERVIARHIRMVERLDAANGVAVSAVK